jgi:hypothetical protein
VIQYFQRISDNFRDKNLWELGFVLLVGLFLGALVVSSPYLPISSGFQKILLVIPFAFTLVILFNNLERLILFTLAIAVPLNLDISLIISPYARNVENMANGRTIVALTELRLSLVMIVVAVGYVLWLVERRGVIRQPVRFLASTTIPALGLIFVYILSLLQASDKQLSIFKIVQLIELFLIYFYLANHLRTKHDLQFFITILMGGMLAESVLMIIQWRTGWSFSIAGITATVSSIDQRASGTFGTANSAAVIVAAYLALACTMFWLFPKNSQKVFSLICFVFGSIALISTAGRAAWGGFIIAILGFFFVGWRRGWVSLKSLIWLFIITLVIGGIFFPVINNRLTANDNGSAASRLMMFRLAWNVISSSPSHLLFGVGANNYALIAPAYYTSDVGNLGYIIDSSVHNAFLLTWAETGLIGLLFFIGILLATMVKAWKHIRSGNRFISLMALGLACAILVMIVEMFVDPFVARPKMLFIWLLISLVTSLDTLTILSPSQNLIGSD